MNRDASEIQEFCDALSDRARAGSVHGVMIAEVLESGDVSVHFRAVDKDDYRKAAALMGALAVDLFMEVKEEQT